VQANQAARLKVVELQGVLDKLKTALNRDQTNGEGHLLLAQVLTSADAAEKKFARMLKGLKDLDAGEARG